MKNLRKIAVILVASLLALCLCVWSACTCFPYSERGLDHYGQTNSIVHLTRDMVPQGESLSKDSLLANFEYIEGDYFLDETGLFGNPRETHTAFIYLVYTEETYLLAKDYMFEHSHYSATRRYDYNGFVFIENLQWLYRNNELDENGENRRPFSWFNMVGYSDEKSTLILMGFSTTSLKFDEENFDNEDWGEFLRKYFPYYDFDA